MVLMHNTTLQTLNTLLTTELSVYFCGESGDGKTYCF